MKTDKQTPNEEKERLSIQASSAGKERLERSALAGDETSQQTLSVSKEKEQKKDPEAASPAQSTDRTDRTDRMEYPNPPTPAEKAADQEEDLLEENTLPQDQPDETLLSPNEKLASASGSANTAVKETFKPADSSAANTKSGRQKAAGMRSGSCSPTWANTGWSFCLSGFLSAFRVWPILSERT